MTSKKDRTPHFPRDLGGASPVEGFPLESPHVPQTTGVSTARRQRFPSEIPSSCCSSSHFSWSGAGRELPRVPFPREEQKGLVFEDARGYKASPSCC